MIFFLATHGHRYTFDAILQWKIADIAVRSYDELFQAEKLPEATYVFTDFDRLGFWELELAADAYRAIAAAGFRVLNDPARVRQRFSLLTALKAAGLNRFNVWRVEDGAWPDRYPVFLRLQSAHRDVLSDLLMTRDALAQAIEGQIILGRPRKDLMIVEYCAEPVRDQMFRKMSVYRVGDRIVPTTSAHDRTWAFRDGELGVAGQADYEWEYRAVVENRYGKALRKAFEIADIEYGRADFGLVDGDPQIYEINTNPFIRPATLPHRFETRTSTQALARDNFINALKAIDTPYRSGNDVANGSLVLRHRLPNGESARTRWTP
jgi:hypothetical protein